MLESKVLHLRADNVLLGDVVVFSTPLKNPPLVGTVERLELIGDDVVITFLDGRRNRREVTTSRGNTVPLVRLDRPNT